MAKSVRASVSKRNSVKRRDTIYKPVEDERTKRLSEKLLAIAEAKIPTDSTNPASKKAGEALTDVVTETDKTASTSVAAPPTSTRKKRAAKGRVLRHRHARNAVIFPSLRKQQQRTGKRGQ